MPRFSSSLRSLLDIKTLLGVAIGASLISAGYAVALVNPLPQTTVASVTSPSIAKQTSVIAESIKADAEQCATGMKDGSVGQSIQTAMDVHMEMAAATPEVETLFDPERDCFSSGEIYDLSGTIPSVGSIINAAKDALRKYAIKKACKAIAPDMSTSPINKSIDKVARMFSGSGPQQTADNLVYGGLRKISPDLGNEYYRDRKDDYTVKFDPEQTDFGGGSAPSTPPGATPPFTTPPFIPAGNQPVQTPPSDSSSRVKAIGQVFQ